MYSPILNLKCSDQPDVGRISDLLSNDPRFKWHTIDGTERSEVPIVYLLRTSTKVVLKESHKNTLEGSPLPNGDKDDKKLKMIIETETIPQYLWPAATPFSKWIRNNAVLFDGKRVLELGSGIGFGGLSVAAYTNASFITFSDFSYVSLAIINLVIERNKLSDRCNIARLKWGNKEDMCEILSVLLCSNRSSISESDKKYDIVIGCDIFYFLQSLKDGLDTAAQALGLTNGVFYCGSFARSERMDDDINRIPPEKGWKVEVLSAESDEGGNNENGSGFRLYQWTRDVKNT